MLANNKINRGIIFCLLIILVFSSCGYSVIGGGDFPEGIQRLSIKIFENLTSETGAENIFTNALIYEIAKHGKVFLTKESRADGILTGVIKSMRIDAISHKDTFSSLKRRVIITLSFQLEDPQGRVIWLAKDVTENKEYDVSSDKQTTERNRRKAIIHLSKRLSEKIYKRLTENF